MAKADSTASLLEAQVAREQPRRARRPKPPIALRPLHRIWRRTLDEIDVTRIRLPVRGLPAALEGMVACQLSDLHVDRDEDLERLVLAVGAVNAQQPDLVFLTGDYFTGPRDDAPLPGRISRGDKRAQAAPGRFRGRRQSRSLVFGRADNRARSNRRARACSPTRAIACTSAAQSLVVVGIDDLWSRRAEPSRAFAQVRPDECTMVLAHNPDTALYARHLKPGVMLSGHTHGGVVRLPFYGSPLKLLRIGKQFYAGLNRYRDFYIYTNRGLGTYWLRIRINCRPEVSRFHLTPLSDAAHDDSRNARRTRRRE